MFCTFFNQESAMLEPTKPRYKCIQHILSCNIFKLFVNLGSFFTRFFRYPITGAREMGYKNLYGFDILVNKLKSDTAGSGDFKPESNIIS